jgi:hypothetical protein
VLCLSRVYLDYKLSPKFKHLYRIDSSLCCSIGSLKCSHSHLTLCNYFKVVALPISTVRTSNASALGQAPVDACMNLELHPVLAIQRFVSQNFAHMNFYNEAHTLRLACHPNVNLLIRNHIKKIENVLKKM